jgi:predicted CoA-binding protein
MSGFQNPSPEQLKSLLQGIHRIAVVGLSPRPNRPSHGVAAALQQFGYQIVPVRPAVDKVLGAQAYPDLYSVPGKIDLVNVFRAPQYVDPIVDACIELNIPAIWFQDGVINVSAALRAQAAGILVVMDRCIYRDYKMLI